jgi:hypothetical protein
MNVLTQAWTTHCQQNVGQIVNATYLNNNWKRENILLKILP